MSNQGLPRSVEIAVSLAGLLIVAPLLILCACLIKATSRGSIFFCQKRIGLNGKPFTLYKFRTMRPTSTGSLITSACDQRITRVGRILRKSKLDELPELWNVARGDMSFVGPRPEIPQFFDPLDPLWSVVVQVRPGITNPVTLQLRNEEYLLATVENKEEFYRHVLQPYKLRGYLKYLKKRTWSSDLIIILQTVKSVALPHTTPTPSLEMLSYEYVES